MASNRLRRISKEIEEAATDTHSHVLLHPASSSNPDLTHLSGQILGPPDTPYATGRYTIDIRIPNDYPFRPPVMKFATRIWHPNVSSQTGAICIDTLSTGWSPIFTIKSALISIQGLLASPEPKDPQDAEVAGMLLNNPKEFETTAKRWAIMYAGADEGDAAAEVERQEKMLNVADEAKLVRDATASRLATYHGYPPPMVDRFCAMGFDIKRVVAAFEHSSVERNGGLDYELDEETVEVVTMRLFNDS